MATSGNFVTSNSGQGGGGYPTRMIFEWWRTGWGRSGSVGYHNINYHFKSYDGNTNYYIKFYNGSMNVDGTGYSWGTTNLYGGGATSFGDYSKTLYTDSSGNRSFSASGQGGIYANTINTSGSGSWSLDNIPMQANVTGGSASLNDEQDPYITFDNPSGAGLDVWLEVNPGGTHYAERNGIPNTGNYTWTLTTTERNQLRAVLASAQSGTIRLGLYTNLGGTHTFASYRDIAFTIINGNPVFTTATYKDANSATVTVTGNDQYIVQGQSTLEVDIASGDKAIAQKQSTMVKYNAFIGAINQDITYTTSAIAQSLGTLGIPADGTLRVRAIDTRALYTDVNLAVSVLPYAAPILTTTVTRTNNFETDSVLHIAATISRLTIASVDKNAVNTSTGVQYRAKKTTDSDYSGWNSGSWTNVTNSTSGGNVSVTDFHQNFDRNYAWNIQIRVVDKLQTTTNEILLPQGIALFRIGLDGHVYNQEQPLARYDIGDIYMTADSSMSSAGAVAGRYGGTWVAWGTGRVPRGMGSNGTTNYTTLEATGGEEKHTQTTGELANHTHGLPSNTAYYVGSGGQFGFGGGSNGNFWGSNITGGSGSTTPFNVMSPYQTVYFWKRTV